MGIESKKIAVASLVSEVEASEAVFFVNVAGISVAEERQLRGALRKVGSRLKVAKISLFDFAAKEALSESIAADALSKINGQLALVFSKEESQLAAKELCSFQRTIEKDLVLGAVYNKGAVWTNKEIADVSKIASKEVVIQRMLYSLSYPVTALALALKEVAAKNN